MYKRQWEDTLAAFDQALSEKPVAAIFTHVSNVFGYVLPVEQLAELCHLHGVPFPVSYTHLQTATACRTAPDWSSR